MVAQQSFAMVLIRFVNSLIDAVQTPPFTLPAYHLATIVGLPSHFVELRHAATHDELPSLTTLRKFAQDALEWQWKNYWTFVGKSDQKKQTTVDKEYVKKLCRDWRRLQRQLVGKREYDDEVYDHAVQNIARSVRDVKDAQEEEFIAALLTQNILLPTK